MLFCGGTLIFVQKPFRSLKHLEKLLKYPEKKKSHSHNRLANAGLAIGAAYILFYFNILFVHHSKVQAGVPLLCCRMQKHNAFQSHLAGCELNLCYRSENVNRAVIKGNGNGAIVKGCGYSANAMLMLPLMTSFGCIKVGGAA